MKRRFLGAAVILCVFALLLKYEMHTQPRPCGGHCDVIFIVVDTLSADHLALFGYDRDTMPRTTAFFLDKGQVFDNASSVAPWTFESFPTIYFSDVPSDISFADLMGARPSVFTALRNAGVQIRGIDLRDANNFILNSIYAPILPDERVFVRGMASAPTPWTTLRARMRLTAATAVSLSTRGEPFLTFTHVLSVHDPYDPDAPFSELFASSTGKRTITTSDLLAINATTSVPSQSTLALDRLRYDQGIAQTDAALGAFLEQLSTTTLAHTAIIITADHGEAFYEHGHVYHGLSLYGSETHIPLFIYVPGLPPRRVRTPVSLLDIAPTILDLEGVHTAGQFKGQSLVPHMADSVWPTDRMLPMQNGYPYFLDPRSVKTHAGVPATLAAVDAASSTRSLLELSDVGVRYRSYVLMGVPGTSSPALYDQARDPREQYDLSAHLDTAPLFDTYLIMRSAWEELSK